MAEQEELDREKEMVYAAAMQLIHIRGLDTFIEYLQEVQETGAVPKSSPLDADTYLQVLRQAVNDYRKRKIESGEDSEEW
jgi:hypothetical protein